MGKMFPFNYYCNADQESIIHFLDPWTKLVILFGIFIFIFFFTSPGTLICLFILLLIMARIAKIPLGYMVYRLKFLFWFFIMGNLFYFFFTPGRVLYHIPWVHLSLTREGLAKGLTLIFQLCLIATASFLVLSTTSTVKLIKSVQSIFYPFFRVGINVPDISLMMIISLQFIPIVLAEGKRIIHIQMMRGGNFQKKDLLAYTKNLVHLVIPIFLALVRKAHTLALAIELRGYTGQVGRQQFYLPRWHLRDIIAFLLAGFFMGGLVLGTKYI